MKDTETEEELTFDKVLEKITSMKGITAVQEKLTQRARIRAGNSLLFVLLRRGQGVIIKDRNKEGKWRYTKIEKPEDLEHWYNYAKERRLRISKK